MGALGILAPAPVSAIEPATMCVVDGTQRASAVRWAVAELDADPSLIVTYRTVVQGCPDTGTWWVMVVEHADPDMPTAWVEIDDSEAAVRLNTADQLTGQQWSLAVLHELVHVVLGHPHGDEWDRQSGHTTRCDSVMADERDCIFRLDGLTAYDRGWIAAAVDAKGRQR